MRRSLTLILVGLILLSAGPAPALAQRDGVGELWEQFPLDDPEQRDGRQAEPTQVAQSPRPRAEDDGGSGVGPLLVPLALALIGLLGYGAARHLRARHQRGGPVPQVAAGRVFVRGFTERDDIGAFAGHLTAHMRPRPSRPEHMICVYDQDLETAVWVRLSELDEPEEAMRVIDEPAATGQPSEYDEPDRGEASRNRRFDSAASFERPASEAVTAGPAADPPQVPPPESGVARTERASPPGGGGLFPRNWDPRRRG